MVKSQKELLPDTVYDCGHHSEPIIMDNNILSVTAYYEWAESVGRNGDKTKCYNCWCKNV